GVRAEPVVSESPFNELLHTNYIPTDAGIAQIRSHLAPHEEELAFGRADSRPQCKTGSNKTLYRRACSSRISSPSPPSRTAPKNIR
ncbi:hypothetical protein R3P38DRAFT_3068362, partial [Favolaschia claudopus]